MTLLATSPCIVPVVYYYNLLYMLHILHTQCILLADALLANDML